MCDGDDGRCDEKVREPSSAGPSDMVGSRQLLPEKVAQVGGTSRITAYWTRLSEIYSCQVALLFLGWNICGELIAV